LGKIIKKGMGVGKKCERNKIVLKKEGLVKEKNKKMMLDNVKVIKKLEKKKNNNGKIKKY
jgi:hypothetical protein